MTMDENNYYSVTFYFVSGKEMNGQWGKKNWDEVHRVLSKGARGFDICNTPPEILGYYFNFNHITHIRVEEWDVEKEKG